MALRCDRCGRAFRNKYAVWGHLRACRPSSVEAEPAQPVSSAYGLAQPGLEPQLGEEFADEERQLRHRRLEFERRDLEREEHAAWERDMEALNTLIQRETEKERRRGIVEEVCSPFADLPYMIRGYQIPPGTRDAAKRRAHEELVRASGARSREELVQIVTQAREQVYAPLLQAQDDARAAEARAVAEREARLAQDREEAQRRAQGTINALPQGLEASAPGSDRFAEESELTEGADGDDEFEHDTEDDLDFEDEPDGNEEDHDELNGDTESVDEEEPAPGGLGGTLFKLGATALGMAMLSKALSSSRVWIADPQHGGDGSFAVGSAPPGPQPPWREASETEIQQGLQSGALRRE
jgi:hypothetical protein